ncbi:hypothetical protein P7K49_015840, partial [Saguinus oedipus]
QGAPGRGPATFGRGSSSLGLVSERWRQNLSAFRDASRTAAGSQLQGPLTVGPPTHLWDLSSPTQFLCLHSTYLSRKPVNMTKVTANCRLERMHVMSAVDQNFIDQSTLQEGEQLGLCFMDTHGYSSRGECPALLPHPHGP